MSVMGRRITAQRQLNAGAPISHAGGEPGAVGIGVRSIESGATLILSCAHVLAPRHLVDGPAGNVIESPLSERAHPGSNRIGVLGRAVPFENTNTIDAAICLPDAGINVPVGVIDGEAIRGPWRPGPTAGVLAGRSVWRISASGERVPGEIIGVEDHAVDMLDGRPEVSFRSVLHYKSPNKGGDSGSAVIDDRTGELMGIHFAGDGGELSLMCLAFLVFDALKLEPLG